MHADVFRPGESRLENRKLRRLGDARIFSSTSAVATARHGAATRGVLRGGASKSSDAIESPSSGPSIKSICHRADIALSGLAPPGGVSARAPSRRPGDAGERGVSAISACASRPAARARARRRRTIPLGGGAAPGGRSTARSKTALRSRRDRETLDARLEQKRVLPQASDEHARGPLRRVRPLRTRVAARDETRRIIIRWLRDVDRKRRRRRAR